ncbi:heme ABC transporter ATP-binding protein [Flaviaesturariibacter terrae]
MLEAAHISYRVGRKTLLQKTTLSFAPGSFHVIMGPNGAGKSTLLRLLAGELKPSSGAVTLGGRALPTFSALELARRRAVLSQHYALQFPISAKDVVQLGRYPHAGALSRTEEEALVADCLHSMDMEGFAERDYGTLSGGEAQKVQMARVLAQLGGTGASGKLLFLDEPVSHLDIRYQQRLLQTAKDLAEQGNTVVAVLHDLNLALRYADRLLFLKEGALCADLADPAHLTAAIVESVFDVPVRIDVTGNGKRMVVFE